MNLESLKAGIAKLTSERARLEGRLEKLKQAYEDAESLPLPKDDFCAMLCEAIDSQADAYEIRLAKTLAGYRNKIGFGGEMTPIRLPFFDARGVGGNVAEITTDSMMYFFGDAVKKAIREHVDAVSDWPECGLPRAERPAELERLDREIAAVERELGELKDAAKSAGVRLEA